MQLNSLSLEQKMTDITVIQLVDDLLKKAIELSASDLHIEPYEKNCRIRLRCHGSLSELTTLSASTANRVVTRIKILANLNIAEKRLPQDGKLQADFLSKIDIRVSTCPTLFGEKIVLRFLNKQSSFLDLAELGLLPDQIKIFTNYLNKPQGMVLVTGPTGSGKTSTLYAALHYLNHVERNIITVEDPVEIALCGINQVNVNTKIGLNYQTILRALLRQDPDVLMIGEIRDLETAQIALQAAQTGHLVFSTLHTNSAIETVYRLQSIGVSLVNLLNSTTLIIAQRLIRNFHGRVAIFELLPITNELSEMILSGSTLSALVNYLSTKKITPLIEVAKKKIKQGLITHEEVIRTLGMLS